MDVKFGDWERTSTTEASAMEAEAWLPLLLSRTLLSNTVGPCKSCDSSAPPHSLSALSILVEMGIQWDKNVVLNTIVFL